MYSNIIGLILACRAGKVLNMNERGKLRYVLEAIKDPH